jgi:hypothetical protein
MLETGRQGELRLNAITRQMAAAAPPHHLQSLIRAAIEPTGPDSF